MSYLLDSNICIAHSRTGHVPPFETFCVGYAYLLSLGIVKTLGTGLQTPSRLGDDSQAALSVMSRLPHFSNTLNKIGLWK